MAKRSRQDVRRAIHSRIRKKVRGDESRPRFAVFRSVNHIYAQLINDDAGVTVCSASTVEKVAGVGKGGNNLSFAALVVVGDQNGIVGFGTGKAKEVPQAIRKAIESAKRKLVRIPRAGTTLPHPMVGRFGAGRVLLKPAVEGTGVIAGGAVRAVMNAVGVSNVLTKCLGSNNPHNVIRATFDALTRMKSPEEVARLRGRTVEEL